MLIDDNRVFNPKYWFISTIGFIILIVFLCNLWLYREFYINQKSAVEEVVDAVSSEINYKLTTIENLLISSSRNFDNKNILSLSDQQIIDSLKIPADVLKYITRIKIIPVDPDNRGEFQAIKLQEDDNNLYFVISNSLNSTLKKQIIQVYLDINDVAQKYLQVQHRSFELHFLFKIINTNHDSNYLLHAVDSKINNQLIKINDIELYNILEDSNLKLSQNNLILGNPNWQIKGYIKQDAIKDFIKLLVLISLLFILIILFISNLAYRRLCNLEKLKSKAVLDKNQAEAKIDYLAYNDSLTNLPNKASLIKYYEDLLIRENFVATQDHKLLTIVINIPMLKEVNDTMGYQYGDNVLAGFTEIVNNFLNSPKIKNNLLEINNNKIFHRSGGNTFVLSVLYHKPRHGKSYILFITNFINMLLSELTKPIKIKEEDLYFSYHAGISIYPDNFKNTELESTESLLRYAEIAMSAARKKGFNKYIFYSEDINTSMLTIFHLENELKRALSDNKLELLLQPQADLKSNKLRGFEALIRWQRENGQIESPGTFIPILEKSGLIVTVGDWILREACSQGMALIKQGLVFDTLSVNISVLQLQSENFIDRMTHILDSSEFPYEKFEIEVTESILFEVPDKIINVLKEIRAKNIKIALDDFGTGFSSLSYLKILPIDYLKIDKSFINELQTSGDSRLLTAILAIARSMNLSSIVEGVESQEQVDFLRATSCDIIQGYYVSKALNLSEVIRLYNNKTHII